MPADISEILTDTNNVGITGIQSQNPSISKSEIKKISS
jgi:hypothetical protein